MAEIIDYTPATAADQWAEDAKTLAGLDEGKAIRIKGGKGARVAFQKAARALDFTARCVGEATVTEPDKDGKGGVYTFDFIATELRTRGEADDAE